MKMLICDDSKQIIQILSDYALKEGYEVYQAFNGQEALDLYKQTNPDIILLDVMMPIYDGFSVCKTIREESSVPIIMITARSDDFDKIMGLDIGADDYIIKPFSPSEIMARVRAIMRRIKVDTKQDNLITYDNISINLEEYLTCINNKKVMLTKKETELLWLLIKNKNKVFSRENLLDSIWGYDYYGDTRTVDSHIKRLRAKLKSDQEVSWQISTIWGIGYKFEELL